MTQLLIIILVICVSTTVFVSSSNLADDKRIANGLPANINNYPYIASYQYLGGHFCGCIILSDVWLLTAAHCVDQALILNLNDLRIVGGISVLGTTPSSIQITKVLRQYRHPLYGGGTTPNDIGLIRAATPFRWTTSVSSALLPYPNDEFSGLTHICGWGYLRSTYPVPSAQLQYADVFIITTNDCNIKVNPYGATVDNRSICTIGYFLRNETSCKGDSGGPLIYYNMNNKAIAIGIMSWNLSPCGLSGSPSVSVKISKYLGWITCRVNNDLTSPTTTCY